MKPKVGQVLFDRKTSIAYMVNEVEERTIEGRTAAEDWDTFDAFLQVAGDDERVLTEDDLRDMDIVVLEPMDCLSMARDVTSMALTSGNREAQLKLVRRAIFLLQCFEDD